MAKKTLLTEGEFKKFMKLARLEPLAAEKLSEMYGEGRGRAPGMRDDKPGMREPGMRDEEEEEDKPGMRNSVMREEEDEEEDHKPGMRGGSVMREEELEIAEDLAALFEEEDEMPEPEETAMEPVDDEPMDMPADDMAGGGMSDLRGQIEDALENLLGLIDQGLEKADMGDVMDVEADDEGDEGMGGMEGGDAEMDAAPPAPEGGMDDEELMETVARRVALRLQRESKVDAKSDLIAERIMERLKNL
jgi:hypothetical protein